MPAPDHRDRPDAARRREGGFVAGAEALLFGNLIFVVGVLLTINAWGVVDAHMTADAVARQVARTLVESDPELGLPSELQGVATAVMDDMQRDTPVTLRFLDADGVAVDNPANLLVRCHRVTVTATLSTNTVNLPFVADTWGLQRQVTGSHTEVVDPFRSGLPGEVDCA